MSRISIDNSKERRIRELEEELADLRGEVNILKVEQEKEERFKVKAGIACVVWIAFLITCWVISYISNCC